MSERGQRVWRLTEIQGVDPTRHGLKESHLWFKSREEAVTATEAYIDAILLVRFGWSKKREKSRGRVNYKIVEYVAAADFERQLGKSEPKTRR